MALRSTIMQCQFTKYCIYFQADSDYIDDYTMLELFNIERFKNHHFYNVIYTFVLLSSLGGGW